MDEVFVWQWLAGADEPVCVGKLTPTGEQVVDERAAAEPQVRAAGELPRHNAEDVLVFQYNPEFLVRDDAASLFSLDLPLTPSVLDPREPFDGRNAVGLIGPLRDCAPDYWGRRVVNALKGLPDDAVLPETEYLLAASGTNRVGALDFQPSGEHYVTHDDEATLADLLELTALVYAGGEIPATLLPAARSAAGVGGARPKALFRDGSRHRLAKFEIKGETRPMVQMEAVAMLLAPYAGIPAETGVEVIDVDGRKVMLIDRFDRVVGDDDGDGDAEVTRRQLVSLRSAVGLGEFAGPVASYPWIVEQIRNGPWADKEATVNQIFRRLVFSIMVGNKDDHLRNTAAFWDGKELTLTPAFDIAPQARWEPGPSPSKQFPGITRDGQRESQLRLCRLAAPEFGLTPEDADAIIAETEAAIREHWDEVCDQALLTAEQRADILGREFLNPYIYADAP